MSNKIKQIWWVYGIRNNQLKANGDRENKKDKIKYPISLYVEKMIKQKKKQSEFKGVKKKKK